MPNMRLPALTSVDVIRIIERAGFCFVRSRGSHRIFARGNRLVIVPFHHRDLRRGTLRAIVKASGLTEEEFLALR
ncbi:type II toxin-antitoxin system HicA family toxin [Candidatus Uhrbacteria bacterium]|nr:type II toxin-antitoxin system HicA family toxin [Candidatus Uhrbacteria bacterium]